MENTPVAQQVFTTYFKQLVSLIQQANKTKNPASYLFSNDARTLLFRLEALARLFRKLHNKKRFTKMLEQFKVLEDGLGQIDYYTALLKETCIKYKLNAKIKNYFNEQLINTTDALNTYLSEEYLSKVLNAERIEKKIISAKWQDDETFKNELQQFYINEIADIKTWLQETGAFTNMEEHVHELRRKLRWLSIYPQALQGKIQLNTSAKTISKYNKYLSKTVLKSPFNKLPKKGKYTIVLTLNKNSFLALSWIIAELGVIKDEGLIQEAVALAIKAIENNNEETSIAMASKLLNSKSNKQKLLQAANKISIAFSKDKVLEELVVG
jgi:hypothetical protein